jgi:hypothetical protein
MNHTPVTSIPRRMFNLPRDPRGAPVPWFAGRDAEGHLRVTLLDLAKWRNAVKNRRCWMCGAPLGRSCTFVLGPVQAIARLSVNRRRIPAALKTLSESVRSSLTRRGGASTASRTRAARRSTPGVRFVANPFIRIWLTANPEAEVSSSWAIPSASHGGREADRQRRQRLRLRRRSRVDTAPMKTEP